MRVYTDSRGREHCLCGSILTIEVENRVYIDSRDSEHGL